MRFIGKVVGDYLNGRVPYNGALMALNNSEERRAFAQSVAEIDLNRSEPRLIAAVELIHGMTRPELFDFIEGRLYINEKAELAAPKTRFGAAPADVLVMYGCISHLAWLDFEDQSDLLIKQFIVKDMIQDFFFFHNPGIAQ